MTNPEPPPAPLPHAPPDAAPATAPGGAANAGGAAPEPPVGARPPWDRGRATHGERDFHYTLATALFPPVLLPFAWMLAFRALQQRHAFWRRIVAIAILDTFLCIGFVGAAIALEKPPEPSGPRPRIGVVLDAAHSDEGARILSVAASSPAEDAGLRPGDVVVQIDGEQVADYSDLSRRIGDGELGEERRLKVLRDDEELGVAVFPVEHFAHDDPTTPFAPQQQTACAEVFDGIAITDFVAPAITGLLLLVLFAVAAMRGRPFGRYALVLIPLCLAPLCGQLVIYGACSVGGGLSMGWTLVGLVAQGMSLFGLGLLVIKIAGPELTLVVGPKLGTFAATRLALLYQMSSLARALMLLSAIAWLAPSFDLGTDAGFQHLFGADHPVSRALIFTAAVIAAPLGEEAVFRGVLLPGFARQMPPGWALVLSSAVFALFHVPSHGAGAIFPGLLGLVFGWARLRTGNLTAPVLLHATNNALVVLLQWTQ